MAKTVLYNMAPVRHLEFSNLKFWWHIFVKKS